MTGSLPSLSHPISLLHGSAYSAHTLSLPSGIFHLIQIKKVRKQDFQREAQNFRLLTGTHEGGTWG